MTTKKTSIVSNEPIDSEKLKRAQQIILGLHQELNKKINNGRDCGPFLAAIYDENGHLIAKKTNQVVHNQCSHDHAEMCAIQMAEKKLKTYDLSSHNLSLYVTAEPCIMCLGGILWSGIKAIYYSVPSTLVESITGFDEGFKPNWLKEFKKRGITVYGNIEVKAGTHVLKNYVQQKHVIYKPNRHTGIT